jgi:hypothetical protein
MKLSNLSLNELNDLIDIKIKEFYYFDSIDIKQEILTEIKVLTIEKRERIINGG